MGYPWQGYMARSSPARETRKAIDAIIDGEYPLPAVVPVGSLGGIPDTVTIGTARVPITGFTEEHAGPGFDGLLDKQAGTIEAPQTGLYRVMGSISGILNGGLEYAELIMFLRPSGLADTGPISAYPIQPSRTNWVAGSFNLTQHLNEGQTIQLQLDCNVDIQQGLMFMFASFEASYRGF